mmetsp:Transcript_39908/g.80633  ORF Transcript_39908/g.80633 Transcript_39908/m.80633 type:complete len:103 (-) Transcript_39908:101-409(-)|eukprot:CAMPEP_0113823378 /NCGR_PEP_ID=MMETSP0328-20130328/2712_1 /TAXON_ID=39455 /ORGANISM="Alexandrium minutum" /LENGTH=102 /DNA_ID=CAMNT_0000791317 /DNA_START=16 /DNA_END=324 /DNA_ORIENTATION=- /assembly_acc=CAM_ASM_000350
MASHGGYRGAREGAAPPRSSKAPTNWSSAAETSRRAEEESARFERHEAVADRAGGGGGGGGGAKLPFMVDDIYVQPVKTGPVYCRVRLSPANPVKPSWALKW